MQLTESQTSAIAYEGRNLQLIACAGSVSYSPKMGR